MTRTTNISSTAICLVTMAIAMIATHVQAQVVPFKVSGAGIVDYIPFPGDPPANHCATGNGTMLGEYFSDGWVRTDNFTSPNTANFSSAVPNIFTAANGDQLHMDYAGEVTLLDAGGGQFYTVWVAEFTPVLGASTGRFAKVTGGSFIMTAVTDAFNLGDTDIGYAWFGDGQLEFDHGN